MKLDFATLAFGYDLDNGTSTPNWSTALGQGNGYKIKDKPGIDEILKGMIYSAVSPNQVSTKIGRGGVEKTGSMPDTPLVSTALFKKVYVNDELIEDGKFILMITKDDSPSHAGRLKLRYSDSNTYIDGNTSYSNKDFFKAVREHFNLNEHACWFVWDISVRHQDELHLKATFVNKNESEHYADTRELHMKWESFVPDLPCPEEPIEIGINKLYYGVPGCGKSYTIKNICSDSSFMERVVFHPDYTNADFVGQILPVIKPNGISYEFKPGPFTKILLKALADEDNMYYLVIEELNRGNASAIFGDIFQLLDRDDSGASTYEISNSDITGHILDKLRREYEKISIPKNLSILATMNTSDQNVFTLDTAFQRRWEMEHIPNDFGNRIHNQHISTEVEAGITWYAFATKINEEIVNVSISNGMSEDKQLGVYFATGDGITDKKKFAEKVLKYLWDDAVKIDRKVIFDTEKVKTFEAVVSAYRAEGLKAVLQSKLYDTMLSCPMPTNEE